MEKQRDEIAEILAKNFTLYDGATTFCAGDFEWCAYQLMENGYRKISEVEKWTTREISEGIENIIAEFERLKAVGFKHDDKWRFDNLVSDIRDFMKEYEEQKLGE